MKVVMPRTGDVPLTFQGEEIGTVQTDQRPPSGRTVTITLYKVDHGGYVAHVHFHSMLGFEPDAHEGIGPYDTVREVAKQLNSIDPGKHMIPSSNDPQIEQVKHMLRDKYLNAITDLLAQFPEAI